MRDQCRWAVESGSKDPTILLAGTCILLAGPAEGTVLGIAQAGALRRLLPGLPVARFVTVTVALAGVGWAAGSVPSLTADPSSSSSAPAWPLMLLLGGLMGATMGGLLGVAQSLVLRKHTTHAWRWVGANLAAWTPAMAILMVGASLPSRHWSLAVVLVWALATGALAGGTLGLILGWFSSSLLGAKPRDRMVLAALRFGRPARLTRSVVGLRLTGRRTRRKLELPVMYAENDDGLWIAVGHADHKQWWRNVGDQPYVEVLRNGSGERVSRNWSWPVTQVSKRAWRATGSGGPGSPSDAPGHWCESWTREHRRRSPSRPRTEGARPGTGSIAGTALELTVGTTILQHLTRVARAVAVPLIAAVLLSGCGPVDQGTNVDPDQLDAVEAPELGACRMLVPGDVNEPSNATKTVPCFERHTAETYAVGALPDRFQDASYGSKELGLFAFQTCASAFRKFLSADESLVMRTVLSWAWFRPSEKAWDDGARWYRCDAVGGGDKSKEYADLPRTARGLLRDQPDEWMACANGPTVESVKVTCDQPHTWRAVTTIKLGEPGDAYPGDRLVTIRTRDFCSKSVGAWMNYPDHYDYGFTWFHEGEWDAGNRRSICWAKTDH